MEMDVSGTNEHTEPQQRTSTDNTIPQYFQASQSNESSPGLHEDIMAIWSFYQYFYTLVFPESDPASRGYNQTSTPEIPTIKQLYDWFQFDTSSVQTQPDITATSPFQLPSAWPNNSNLQKFGAFLKPFQAPFQAPNIPHTQQIHGTQNTSLQTFPPEKFLTHFFRLTSRAEIRDSTHPATREHFKRYANKVLGVAERKMNSLNDPFYQVLVPSYNWNDANHEPWWQFGKKEQAKYFSDLNNKSTVSEKVSQNRTSVNSTGDAADRNSLAKTLQETEYTRWPSKTRARVFRELCDLQFEKNKRFQLQERIDAILENAYKVRLNSLPSRQFTQNNTEGTGTFQIREIGSVIQNINVNDHKKSQKTVNKIDKTVKTETTFLYLCGHCPTDFAIYKFSTIHNLEKTDPELVATNKLEIDCLMAEFMSIGDTTEKNTTQQIKAEKSTRGSKKKKSSLTAESSRNVENLKFLMNELKGIIASLDLHDKHSSRRERTLSNRLKQLDTWDVNQNPQLENYLGLGSRRKRTQRKTYTFTEYDEQIDSVREGLKYFLNTFFLKEILINALNKVSLI